MKLFRRKNRKWNPLPRVEVALLLGIPPPVIRRAIRAEEEIFITLGREKPPKGVKKVFSLTHTRGFNETVAWLENIIQQVARIVGIIVGDPAFNPLLSALDQKAYEKIAFIVAPSKPAISFKDAPRKVEKREPYILAMFS